MQALGEDFQHPLSVAHEPHSDQDLETGIPRTKFVAYERDERFGCWALRGVYAVGVLAILLSALGFFLLLVYEQHGDALEGFQEKPPYSPIITHNVPFKGAISFKFRSEVLGLALNVVITLCTETVGLIHGAALK